MDRVISSRTHVARKTYLCDASAIWRSSGYNLDDCQSNEQRLIVEAAESDRWKILPGQAYRKLTLVSDGSICTYRARIGMDSLCYQLGLFDE